MCNSRLISVTSLPRDFYIDLGTKSNSSKIDIAGREKAWEFHAVIRMFAHVLFGNIPYIGRVMITYLI